MRTSFWTYFTSGYGIIWMIFLGFNFIGQTYTNAGVFGLIGFPIIAAIYATMRWNRDSELEERRRDADNGERRGTQQDVAGRTEP